MPRAPQGRWSDILIDPARSDLDCYPNSQKRQPNRARCGEFPQSQVRLSEKDRDKP